MGQIVISHKLCGYFRVYLIIYRGVSPHIVCHSAGYPGLFSLLFHGCLETGLVNGDSLIFQDFLGQIQRESVSII